MLCICRAAKNMQNYFSPTVHLFKPLRTPTKKGGIAWIHDLVALHQFLTNILEDQEIRKCASTFFNLVSPIQIHSNKRQPRSRRHTTIFFPLSYLKPTYVTSFKSTLSFSMNNYVGIMKKPSPK